MKSSASNASQLRVKRRGLKKNMRGCGKHGLGDIHGACRACDADRMCGTLKANKDKDANNINMDTREKARTSLSVRNLLHDTSKNQLCVCLVCAMYFQHDVTVHSLLRCLVDPISHATGRARSCCGKPSDILPKGICLQQHLIMQLAGQTRCHESRTDAEENLITSQQRKYTQAH